jgi:HD-GYP domain-containing protein (c-di-GMP phosphodiesterase class II)
VPLSGVIGALSYALDLTEGEPPGHAVRTCLIGMRLAQELGLGEAERSDLFYALLLKDAGCSANSARMAALFAVDDRHAKRSSKRVDWARSYTAFLWTLRTVAPGAPLRSRAAQLLSIREETEITRSLMRARCERGAEIARLIGLGPRTAAAIRALDEHWDGHGQPEGLRGEEIPLGGRILCLAQTVEIFHAARGLDAALRVASRRSGGWFDPRLVAALKRTRGDLAFWRALPGADLAAWEPEERRLTADETYLDRIADAFAGVVDAKSPWTYRHSDRTCVIAMSIAALLGCDDGVLNEMRRAALLHDVGKLAISNRILDKPARLTDAEYALVRRHPLHTAAILERTPGFAGLAALAGAHHERLDGSGYPHGLDGGALTVPMRVLAVADVYEALTSARPYRPARSSAQALEIMRPDVPSRLDRDAFSALEAVLEERLPDTPAAHAAVDDALRAETVIGRHIREPRDVASAPWSATCAAAGSSRSSPSSSSPRPPRRIRLCGSHGSRAMRRTAPPSSTTASVCSRSARGAPRTSSCSAPGRRRAPPTSSRSPRASWRGRRAGRSGRSNAARTCSRTTACSTGQRRAGPRRGSCSTTTSATSTTRA